MRLRFLAVVSAVMIASAITAGQAWAQADEIQVYDGELTAPHKFNLTWHNNFTPKGIAQPAFPGGVVADKSFNGVTEWAYGVTQWFEAGLYLPLYSIDSKRGAVIDGFKLRTLFAVPHADDRRFFYGSNFEFSFNAKYWDPKRFSSEIRPIVGWHLHPVDIVINPIVDTEYDGIKNLEFVPSTRVAYNVSSTFAVAAETYSDFGPVRGFLPRGDQAHQLYAVFDKSTKFLEVEAGAGFGLTGGSDKFQLKPILSRDLNGKH